MKSVFGFTRVALTPGKVVRSFRSSFGITIKELSEITKLEASNISAIENDRRDVGALVAAKLGAALGLPPEMIMFPKGYRRPNLEREVHQIEMRAAAMIAKKHNE
jgi:plasmid maintenance system antidote protein VapI